METKPSLADRYEISPKQAEALESEARRLYNTETRVDLKWDELWDETRYNYRDRVYFDTYH